MLHALDFWLGRWNVFADGEPAGTNVVEPALDGHAVLEHWRGASGAEGKSLFWYDERADTWRQLWVAAGHHKEKRLVESSPGRVRFAGVAYVYNCGQEIADRTTLTAAADGTVRQLIEHSLDGKEWRTSFDAVYRPA